MLLRQPGVIACNATPVRDTQGDALVTSETGGRWPRPVCHPRGLGSLPGRVPASLLHPPRAPPHFSSSAHGDFPAHGSLLSVASTMSSRACWGTSKHFISWAKRAPCEQIGEPTQGDPTGAWHRASRRSPTQDWHQRNDCLPKPLSFQAMLISHLQRLMVPGWSSRGCPGRHHRATLPVPPPAPFTGQHIAGMSVQSTLSDKYTQV